MYIKEITLHNFRAAKDLTINLNEKINLIIGINGAGKSTILQAISYALVVLTQKINNTKKDRDIILSSDIYEGEEQCQITITTEYNNKSYSWNIERTKPGKMAINQEDLTGVIELSNQIKQADSMPVLVYYPVKRIVGTPNLQVRDNVQESLEIYNNALEGRPNFQNFFTWLREQDDLLNQMTASQFYRLQNFEEQNQEFIDSLLSSLPELSSKLHGSLKRGIFYFIDHVKSYSYCFHSILEDVNFLEDLKHELNDQILDSTDKLSDLHRKFINTFKKYRINSKLTDNFELLEQAITDYLTGILKVVKESDAKLKKFILELFKIDLKHIAWNINDESYELLVEKLSTLPMLDNSNYNEWIQVLKESFIEVLHIEEKDYIHRKENYEQNLSNISNAIEKFIPEYTNIRIVRHANRRIVRHANRRAEMLVDKGGQPLNITQLSDGEKNLIALIGDITRRLTIGNPHSQDPLQERGIILIDELDLHLHPKWQRLVAERLPKVFPNCQFIFSSHSPQIISHIKSESIVIVENTDGVITANTVDQSYGKNSNDILLEIMDVPSRPIEVEQRIYTIFDSIQDGDINKAKEQIKQLKKDIGNDADLIKANILLKRKEIIGK